ncbi:MAG: FtsX-like permease family protein [Steroidobacteraceae bacterium]
MELPTAAQVRNYRTFLYDYAAEQRQLGRFHWAPKAQLHDVNEWLVQQGVVPEQARVNTLIGLALLVVCLINAVGLMLAKFGSRARELGVRRAMGGSQTDIFFQCLIETAVVGLAGGLLGLTLTAIGLAADRALLAPGERNMAHGRTNPSRQRHVDHYADGGSAFHPLRRPLPHLACQSSAAGLAAQGPLAGQHCMQILAVLKSLRHNQVGTLLIVLQIAITLAVVSNCLSVILDNLAHMRRPTGVDEPNIFVIGNQWLGNPADLGPRIQTDLAAIRLVPGHRGRPVHQQLSPAWRGRIRALSLTPDQKGPTAPTAKYFVDEHGLATYGLKLATGRWFTADEVGELRTQDVASPPVVIITAALAHKLYPATSALGQVIYWDPSSASRIVGVVEQAQAPSAAWTEARAEYSTFLPYRYINNFVMYIVRARPGQISSAMSGVEERLFTLTRQRIIEDTTFAQLRTAAYFGPRSASVLMGALCAVLLAVTVFGIVGLTTYWVGQRRRYIGMRRALGARRVDILGYFHTENLVIGGGGVLLGILLGLGGNIWLSSHLQIGRMSVAYICIGAAVLMAVSQASVFFPALRAASIPPTEAIRSL